MKFYEITATQTVRFCVYAPDDKTAWRIAVDIAGEAMDDYGDAPDVDGVREIAPDDAEAEYGDDLPYTSLEYDPEAMTVAELIEYGEGNPPPDESKGPVAWCDECGRERVQFDWREERQLCRFCREEQANAA